MTISLPSPHEPFVDLQTGKVSEIWYRYLSQTVVSLTSLESVTPLTSITYATQADEETGTSSTAVVAPGVQQYHPSAAKVWGYVTMAGTVATVAASYNVNTAASTAAGYLRVDLSASFSSTNYVVVAMTQHGDSATQNRSVMVPTSVGLATTSFTLLNQDSTGANDTPDAWYFVCYGDQ